MVQVPLPEGSARRQLGGQLLVAPGNAQNPAVQVGDYCAFGDAGERVGELAQQALAVDSIQQNGRRSAADAHAQGHHVEDARVVAPGAQQRAPGAGQQHRPPLVEALLRVDAKIRVVVLLQMHKALIGCDHGVQCRQIDVVILHQPLAVGQRWQRADGFVEEIGGVRGQAGRVQQAVQLRQRVHVAGEAVDHVVGGVDGGGGVFEQQRVAVDGMLAAQAKGQRVARAAQRGHDERQRQIAQKHPREHAIGHESANAVKKSPQGESPPVLFRSYASDYII